MFSELSKREHQVCLMVCNGMTNKEIARALTLSPRTIEDYKSICYRKLKVRNIAELVRMVVTAELTAM